MASGFSRRFGKNKLLIQLGGEPLVEKVIKTLSCVDDIEKIIVYRHDKVREIGERYGFRCVYNSDPEKGQSESIKLGVESSSANTNGYMFFVGDQPYISRKTAMKLIESFYRDDGKSIILPKFKGKSGNPVIFPASLRESLLSIPGDNGGKFVISKNSTIVKKVEIEDELELMDIDTEENLNEILERVKR